MSVAAVRRHAEGEDGAAGVVKTSRPLDYSATFSGAVIDAMVANSRGVAPDGVTTSSKRASSLSYAPTPCSTAANSGSDSGISWRICRRFPFASRTWAFDEPLMT